jgi:hypothetical protein
MFIPSPSSLPSMLLFLQSSYRQHFSRDTNAVRAFLLVQFLIGLTSVVFDQLIAPQSTQSSGLKRALADSACHGVVSSLSWLSVLILSNYLSALDSYWSHTALQALAAAVLGCLLDADHFIAAGSLSLHGATHLSSRPFGHAVLFTVVVAGVLFCMTRSVRGVSLLVSSWFAHLLRDSGGYFDVCLNFKAREKSVCNVKRD